MFISKRIIYLAQQGKCFFCSKAMSPWAWEISNPTGWTRDHIYPTSKATRWVIPQKNNAVLCCAKCNRKKSNAEPTKKQIQKYNKLWVLLGKVL